MARPKSFDESTVLAGAMGAFRRLGYVAISIKDLERATGLSAGSIYNAFGDKAGLFSAAYAHYLDTVLKQRIAAYADPLYGLAGVKQLFTTLLAEPDDENYGCLITNSAIEFGAASDEPKALVREGFDILQAALLQSLIAEGSQREGLDPETVAIKLVALYQGVLVLVRAGYDKEKLSRAIDSEFDALQIRSATIS